MRVGAHVAWWAVIAVLTGVFVLSLGSDVWEAYLSLWLVAVVGYALAIWRSRRKYVASQPAPSSPPDTRRL